MENWHSKGFFGIHYDLHPHAKDTELGREATYDHIYKELKKVMPDAVNYDCKGHPGYTGYPTKVGTPSPGIVKDALKVWREVTKKLGIKLAIHYSGVWDIIAIEKHPEWARIGADGKRDINSTCRNHGYTEELMIPQLLEVVKEYDLDGMWVDGENWGSGTCYCEKCVERFTKETGIADIPQKASDPNWQKWLAVNRSWFEEHVRKYADAVHKLKPDCLVCSNWMYSVREPDEVKAPLDYLSGDFDPSFGCERAMAEARFLDSRGITWNLMAWGFFFPGGTRTFKDPVHLFQESAEVMANGGNLFIYDQPKRSGKIIGWHQDIIAKVAKFCRKRQKFCQGTKSVPQAAILHNSAHLYSKMEPLFSLSNGHCEMEGALHALLENGLHVDILNEFDLARRISEYPLVVIPEQTLLPEKLVNAVKEYVKNGGRLLVTGPEPAKAFADVLGITPVEGELQNCFVPVKGKETVLINGQWQKVTLSGAKELSPLLKGNEISRESSETAGSPAATINKYGKGLAAGIYGSAFLIYYNSRLPRIREFIGSVLGKLGNPGLIKMDAPARVELSVRKKDNKIILNLVNRGTTHPLSTRNHAVEGVPLIDLVKLSVPLKEKPKKVSLGVDEGAKLKWKYAKGRLACEVRGLHIHNAVIIEK